MRCRTCLTLAVPALVLVASALPAADPADAARVAQFVAQLGSDSYAEREAATKALDEIGEPALGALRTAAKGKDPEVRRRAAALVRAIDKRVETAKLLEPHKVRLACKDTPLSEALADFSKRSGVTLKLAPDAAKAAGERKVTLDTGDVPFWEAFDKLCEAAGVAELLQDAATANPGGNTVVGSSIVIRGGGIVRTPTDILRTESNDKPIELTLGDGKPVARPTHLAGAVRVRLAPPELPLPNHKKEDGEAVVGLDVIADSRLLWQKAVGLRIDKAVDEDGRTLAQLPTSFKPQGSAAGARTGVFINGMPVTAPPEEPTGLASRLVAVRLQQPAKPAKKLKELRGTVTGQVRTPQQELVTVPNVLKSAGQTVKGAHGGVVKVISATKEENGEVTLKVQVEAAPRGLNEVPATNPFGATVIVNGRRVGEEDNLLTSLHFALVDDKGKPFRTTKATSTGTRAGAALEYELTYEPAPGVGEASKFVYSDHRTLLIDVPFVLKDVPLP